jgi:protein-S-isoprenylcysteine O-methyltransferase Ste14
MLGAMAASPSTGRSPVAAARAWFALQAIAGAAWWVAVLASDEVRARTLGTWSPAILVVPDLVLFVVAAALAAATGHRIAAAMSATWTVAVTAALGATAVATGRAGVGAALMVIASLGAVPAALVLWFGRMPTAWFFVGPFAFREAEERTPSQHLRRSLAQLVVFWSTFLLGLPALLAWAEGRADLRWALLDAPAWRAIGAGTFLVASAVGLWSCRSMAIVGHGTPLPAETARRLVVVGPYRWVRNPMAVAGAFQTAGVGLWLGSWTVLVAAVAGCVVWDSWIRPTEEADLLERFGDPYARYAETVRCWWPRRPRERVGR